MLILLRYHEAFSCRSRHAGRQSVFAQFWCNV